MRFSAVQEDGYGVGLGQETPPNDVDESMMAATGDVEPGGGTAVQEGSMISNLPLLFANGYPTSLEKITLPELERFINFMVQCSLGHESSEGTPEPQWWPKEIKFSIPLVRPKKINESYMGNLKKLVFRCYTYHRSEYLLRFGSYLAQYPYDKLEYVNNWDSTTSLFLKPTGKLLVTFRNENMEYDRKIQDARRMLLSFKGANASYPNGTKSLRRRSAQKQAPSPAMVEPPSDDIYLCDNCDAEFIGLCKMKEHEKLCYRIDPRPITPDVEVQPEIKQDQFMDYFKLSSNTSTNNKREGNAIKYGSDSNSQNRSSSRIRSSVNLTRCPTIPFSSPAGIALGKKSKMMTEVIQQERLDRIERHLSAPPLTSSFKPKWFTKTYDFDRWSVTYRPTYRPTRDRAMKKEYVHLYNFGNYNGKPMLDLRSQQLFMACKPIYVRVERMTDERIVQLMNDPSLYKTPEREVPRPRPVRSPSIETYCSAPPADESDIICIDLDDDEPLPSAIAASLPPAVTLTPIPVQQPSLPAPHPRPAPPRLSASFQPVSSTVAAVAPLKPASSIIRNSNIRRPTPSKRPRPAGNKSIIYVDLCSTDDERDEDDEVLGVESDSSGPCIISTPPQRRNMEPIQHRRVDYLRGYPSKPCFYPADSATAGGHWLAGLTDPQPPRSMNTSFHHHHHHRQHGLTVLNKSAP